MHPTGLELMRTILRRLPDDARRGRVLEVGSLNVNGSYRALFEPDADYTGVDLESGPGVDVVGNIVKLVTVTRDRFADFDLVISGQALEHDPAPHLTVTSMVLACVGGGHVCLVAPFIFPLHHLPDYWRFTGEGLNRLLLNGLELAGCDPTFTKYGVTGEDSWAFCRKVPLGERVELEPYDGEPPPDRGRRVKRSGKPDS